jgi:GNAT superfamily N-acetyltransferase
MNLGPFAGSAGDLAPGDRAPGDRGVLAADWTDFTVDSVRSREDPAFEEGYRRLWTEFGPKAEMESRDVIGARLAWDPCRPEVGCALLYEMLVVRRRGEVVAVRDHTAILRRGAAAVVVHLSHVLVEPALRGSGLASWLRALPVTTARRCAALADGGGADVPVTLVAEMERDDGVTPAVVRRLRSYAKAGFSLVDPARLDYHQPDFRSAAEIDASACTPLRLSLVIRRVGREQEHSVAGAEVALLVDALYRMFGVHQRPADMDAARRATGALPDPAEEVALLVPGAVATRESDR